MSGSLQGLLLSTVLSSSESIVSDETDIQGNNTPLKFYVSQRGEGYCEHHAVHNGGSYLTAEIRAPRNTVSQRYTLHDEGCEMIVTPLDTWLVLTAEQGGYCESCRKQEEA